MRDLTGSKTEQNLITSFAAESQARTRYNFYATRAEQEGLVQIAKIFDDTAAQEYEHARRFLNFLKGGEAKIDFIFPTFTMDKTHENLLFAAELELFVHGTAYPMFADDADSEGFTQIADAFHRVSVAEEQHESMYRELADNVKQQRTFVREEVVRWHCLKCGYIHEGKTAPTQCPACLNPMGSFEILRNGW